MALFLYEWPPFLSILLITFLITLATTLVYKYTTDQKRMKELKEKSKKYQKQMRESRDSPEKMMKINAEAMKVSMELMRHSFKPMLYTMLPLLLIFWWLNAHMAYVNLAPGQEFDITAKFGEGIAGNASIAFVPPTVELLGEQTQGVADEKVVWRAKAPTAGTYNARVTFGGASVEKQFLVSSEKGDYATPVQTYKGAVEEIEVGYEPIRPFGDSFSLFGWRPGWLATYIVLSIIISVGLRKLLNVV